MKFDLEKVKYKICTVYHHYKRYSRSILLTSLIFLAGCKKDPSVWKIENLNGDKILVFGHGGMGEKDRYPMDSYESLSTCLSLRPDGTEMDVCLSKDGVLVLCHGQDLSEQTGCTGLIKSKNWNELAGCKFKTPLFERAELIPVYYFLNKVVDRNTYIFTFDCKVTLKDSSEYLELFAQALVDLIEKYNLVSNCFIESFNEDFLRLLHSKNEKLHLFLYSSNLAAGLESSKDLNLYGLTLDTDHISANGVKQAHAHGLRVTLFNTRTEHENLDAIAKSPDFIQTDKVDFLIHALE